MQRLKYISLSACLSFFMLRGISQQIPFVNYTPRDGLVNNRVKKMVQDSRGQLYFLTFGGLSVYDGTGFVSAGPGDGLRVAGNRTHGNRNDRFWII